MNGAILGESLVEDPEEMYVALEMIQKMRLKHISEVADNKTKEEKLEELRKIQPWLLPDAEDEKYNNFTIFLEHLADIYPDIIIVLNINRVLRYVLAASLLARGSHPLDPLTVGPSALDNNIRHI